MSSSSSSGKEIVIIGGGVIGLSVAYQCLNRGHGVTVLERGPDNRDCCSLGNAGMVVPSHFVPLAAPGMVMLGDGDGIIPAEASRAVYEGMDTPKHLVEIAEAGHLVFSDLCLIGREQAAWSG